MNGSIFNDFNKEKISIVLILSFMILILFSGASTPSSCSSTTTTKSDTSGLFFSFVEDAPPSMMITNEEYPFYLDLQNMGGADIQAGQVKLYFSGLGDNFKNLEIKRENQIFLNKKSTYQDGGKERIVFAENAIPWKNLPSSYSINTKVDMCYDYSTIAQTVICVGSKDDVCAISGEKITTSSNTAAPVQISSITETIEGNKLYLTIGIANKGKGNVYYEDASCDKIYTQDLNERSKQGNVYIKIDTDPGFLCSLQATEPPYGTKQGTEGMASLGTISCVKQLSGESTYSTPIQIILKYKYYETATNTFTVLPQ